MAEVKGRVCVTGGTGFIASMMIKTLLTQGYSVNTTIRSASGNKKRDLSFLTNLPCASEKLKFFNADLKNPESFGPAMEGCIGVFHTAASFGDEPLEALIKTTVGGALGVLKAAKDSKTVKRVVFTASCSSVVYSGKVVEGIGESYWSDVDFMAKTRPLNYGYSITATLAEKAVLKFGEQHGLDVVAVILPFVIGPFICPKLPDSVHMALPCLFGVDQYGTFLRFPLAHVVDVVRAHIFLLEHPNPKGRYICSLSGTISLEEITELVRAKFPELQTKDLPKEIPDEKMPSLSSKKLIDAGFEFKHGTEEIIEETVKCCKENGYL